MKKANIRLLISLLCVLSIVTFFNSVIMYWAPAILPFSSFSAVRLVFLACIEKDYWLIILSLIICVQLFLAAVSVYRRHILLPIMSLIYLIYDLVMVLFLIIDGLGDGYWRTYIIQTVVTTTTIVLLFIYCWTYFPKKYKHM